MVLVTINSIIDSVIIVTIVTPNEKITGEIFVITILTPQNCDICDKNQPCVRAMESVENTGKVSIVGCPHLTKLMIKMRPPDHIDDQYAPPVCLGEQ